LTKHGVDEGRFSVVDVGDDRKITDVWSGFHNPASIPSDISLRSDPGRGRCILREEIL
jgi:hypothetical protein